MVSIFDESTIDVSYILGVLVIHKKQNELHVEGQSGSDTH